MSCVKRPIKSPTPVVQARSQGPRDFLSARLVCAWPESWANPLRRPDPEGRWSTYVRLAGRRLHAGPRGCVSRASKLARTMHRSSGDHGASSMRTPHAKRLGEEPPRRSGLHSSESRHPRHALHPYDPGGGAATPTSAGISWLRITLRSLESGLGTSSRVGARAVVRRTRGVPGLKRLEAWELDSLPIRRGQLQRVANEPSHRVDVQLLHDAGPMTAHGTNADAQDRGDFL